MTKTDTSREAVERHIERMLPARPVPAGYLPSLNDDTRSLLRALRDELDAVQGLRVKPLEWRKSHIDPWDGDHHTVPTGYTIRGIGNEDYRLTFSGGHGVYNSPEAAMRAAQSHYETRILSALTPSPSEWNAAIEAAADIINQEATLSEEVIKSLTGHEILHNIFEVTKSGTARKYAKMIRALKRPTGGEG